MLYTPSWPPRATVINFLSQFCLQCCSGRTRQASREISRVLRNRRLFEPGEQLTTRTLGPDWSHKLRLDKGWQETKKRERTKLSKFFANILILECSIDQEFMNCSQILEDERNKMEGWPKVFRRLSMYGKFSAKSNGLNVSSVLFTVY